MSLESAIEWTHATWNPWRGCDKISPGCAHCYMFTEQRCYGRDPSVVVRAADPTFYAPARSRKWREAAAAKAAEGRTHLVFTCSWSDWFHEDADPWRAEAWEIIRDTPQHTYQVLTKRPERILSNLPPDWGDGYPNVWMGVTIENRRFVHRADLLRAVPAVVRFISAEPLLGPLVCPLCKGSGSVEPWGGYPGGASCPQGCANLEDRDKDHFGPSLELRGIDWLIAGGESGPGHRRIEASWALDLRDACADAGTAFLFKQWGGATSKSGGRVLDGRTYDALPRG